MPDVGLRFPSPQRHLLHSIIKLLVDVTLSGFGYLSSISGQGSALWGVRILPSLSQSASSSSGTSSRAVSPSEGRTASPVLATLRCPSPTTAVAPRQAVNEAGQETDGLWEILPMEH